MIWIKKGMRFFKTSLSSNCLVLGLLVLFGLSFPLSADRIYLKNGNVLRGKVLRGKVFSIGAGNYKFEIAKGVLQIVPRNKIKNVTYSRGKSERGYERFFARINAGLGAAQNTLTISDARQQQADGSSEHLPLRLGADAGYQVIDYQLSLHGGLEYSYSDLLKNKDASYNYLVLKLGGSYYLPIPNKWPRLLHNTQIGLQARLLLNGSARFSFPNATGGEVNSAMEADGLGFGLSLAKEWYTSDWKILGVSLSYTLDSFQIPEQETQNRAPVLIPGTPDSASFAGSIEGLSEMSFIGLNFSLAYD